MVHTYGLSTSDNMFDVKTVIFLACGKGRNYTTYQLDRSKGNHFPVDTFHQNLLGYPVDSKLGPGLLSCVSKIFLDAHFFRNSFKTNPGLVASFLQDFAFLFLPHFSSTFKLTLHG